MYANKKAMQPEIELPLLKGDKDLWWIGSSPEWFEGGSFETREEAIAAGENDYDGDFHIVLARIDPVDLASDFDLDSFMDDVDSNGDYLSGQGADSVFENVDRKDLHDLQWRIRKTIREWQIELQAKGVEIKGDLFTHQREAEHIRPEPKEEDHDD